MGQLPFDLRSLRAFVAVCEGDSMAEAAKRLNITQSAVSQLIKNLEDQTGLMLFDRGFRPLRPTAQGLVLLELAKGLLAQAKAVAERLSSHSLQLNVRIGCVDSFSGALGAALVRAISGRAQRITMWSGLTPSLTMQIKNRELDIAICTEMSMELPQIAQQFLFLERMVAVCAVDQSYDTRDILQRSDLPIVRYSRRSVIGQQVERFIYHLGIKAEDRFEFDATEPILDLVSHGEGFAITTPLCLWQSRHFLPHLRLIPLPESPLGTRSFYLLAREGELSNLVPEIAHVTKTLVLREAFASLKQAMPQLPDNAISAEVIYKL